MRHHVAHNRQHLLGQSLQQALLRWVLALLRKLADKVVDLKRAAVMGQRVMLIHIV
jgi:hypothetical protein